jgi:hypothetical protein|tara:strand:- start:1242 stop:1535 length:294 start_codon:yes stop_codon:yes gene_type:complete
MSDDEDKDRVELGVTVKEGAVILRDEAVPIFIYPQGPGPDNIDVYMQMNFIKFCMNQTEYVSDYLEWLDTQGQVMEDEKKKKKAEEKRKKFTLIKKP